MSRKINKQRKSITSKRKKRLCRKDNITRGYTVHKEICEKKKRQIFIEFNYRIPIEYFKIMFNKRLCVKETKIINKEKINFAGRKAGNYECKVSAENTKANATGLKVCSEDC
jgi:hypothetical protein